MSMNNIEKPTSFRTWPHFKKRNYVEIRILHELYFALRSCKIFSALSLILKKMQEEWDCEWTLVDDQVRADVESEYDDLVSGLRTRDPGFDLTSHSKPMPVHIRVNFR